MNELTFYLVTHTRNGVTRYAGRPLLGNPWPDIPDATKLIDHARIVTRRGMANSIQGIMNLNHCEGWEIEEWTATKIKVAS